MLASARGARSRRTCDHRTVARRCHQAFASSTDELLARWAEAPRDEMAERDVTPLLVFTIGHSTRSTAEMIRLLKAHAPVSESSTCAPIPRSRHNPQFDRPHLSPAFRRAGIHYRHLPGLGGLRRARRGSDNTGWVNVSFRGYADYMQTPTFTKTLNRCIALAALERVVLMCAEGVPCGAIVL